MLGSVMDPVKQRTVIRFPYLKGRIQNEAFDEMKEVYGEDALSHGVAKHWHRQFKSGRTFVKMNQIPGYSQSAIDDTTHQIPGSRLRPSFMRIFV